MIYETCEDRDYRCCEIDNTPEAERDMLGDWYDRHVRAFYATPEGIARGGEQCSLVQS